MYKLQTSKRKRREERKKITESNRRKKKKSRKSRVKTQKNKMVEINPNSLVITIYFNSFKFLVKIQRLFDWITKKFSSVLCIRHAYIIMTLKK